MSERAKKPDDSKQSGEDDCGESLADKIARYSSDEFKAAITAHFHAAKRLALRDARLGRQTLPPSEQPPS